MLPGLLKVACKCLWKYFWSELKPLLFSLFFCGYIYSTKALLGQQFKIAQFISLLIFRVLVLVYKFFLLSWTLPENVNPSAHPITFHQFPASCYLPQPPWTLFKVLQGGRTGSGMRSLWELAAGTVQGPNWLCVASFPRALLGWCPASESELAASSVGLLPRWARPQW